MKSGENPRKDEFMRRILAGLLGVCFMVSIMLPCFAREVEGIGYSGKTHTTKQGTFENVSLGNQLGKIAAGGWVLVGSQCITHNGKCDPSGKCHYEKKYLDGHVNHRYPACNSDCSCTDPSN